MTKKENNIMAPKVSVIIPTYSRADLLQRAVKSVLAQTFCDFELIIVDDCSPDNTKEIVQNLTDPRIRSIRHETNRGAAATRNTGIAHAKGKYIAFLDDDDECTPNRLADQVAVLDANPDVGMVYGWIEEMNDSNGAVRIPKRVQNRHRGRAAFEAALTGISDIASMPYPCFRLSVVWKVGGYDERLATVGEDTVLMASVTQISEAEYVPSIVARTHVSHGHDQLSQNVSPGAYCKFMEIHMSKFYDELKQRPTALAIFHASSAVGLMRVRQVRMALVEFGKVIRLQPINSANLARVIELGTAFIWYVSPLRKLRAQARNIRSVILGSGKRQIS